MCDVFGKNKKDLFRPPSRLTQQQRPVIGRRDIEVIFDWSALYCPPAIGYNSSMSHHVIVHRVMLSSMCYRPKGYVINHRAMLSSKGLCYRSHVIVQEAILSSLETFFRPRGYVIVQGAMLSSKGLCYRPGGYAIFQGAMLSSRG